jgi:sterol desaturase/sphingolipid hydroxylase (fatty acid hydroxylase superfamily)
LSSHKQLITNGLLPKEEYTHEFDINVVISTSVETFADIIIISNYTFVQSSNMYVDLIYFIPTSFLFELVFDLFHYISHRILHHQLLYKYIHKKHHKFPHPSTIITFYQHPIDIILTNSVPIILTLLVIPKISLFQLNLIITYKTYGEICGHLSKKCYPSSSFCQFIWLPKLLNIELYTEEHDLHHSLNNCNFSKRFSLWDKMFETFTPYSCISKYERLT